jgi:hydrogenase maturation protease
MPEAAGRTLVMGIGNVLMKDEGVGCRIAGELVARYEFPESCEVIDSGTMGMSVLHLFKEYEFILVIDAMDGTGHPPGTVVRLSPDDIAPNAVLHSLHDMRFIDVLEAAEMIGCRPQGECVGIQVEDMTPADLTIGLTDPVEAAIDTAIDAVLTVLAERGVEVRERD